MAYIEEYWLEKEKMAEQARQHTEEMERMYSGKIKESVKGTRSEERRVGKEV